jgi:methionyl-tRNA synthetase
VVENPKTGTTANDAQSYLPLGIVDPVVREQTDQVIREYERFMYDIELHSVMNLMDGYLRYANTYWNDHKNDEGDEATSALRSTFHLLRVAAVLMHPIAPLGTERILEYLEFPADYWNWEHIDETNEFFCSVEERVAGRHPIRTLLPRTDFFEKHPSQY